MRVTNDKKALINKELVRQGKTMTALGEAIGKSRSWVSKLLREKDSLPNISLEDVEKINDYLNIRLRPGKEAEEEVNSTVRQLSKLSESDSRISAALEAVLALAQSSNEAYIPIVHQKDLIKIGAKMTEIVMRWEEGGDPHYAKIGAEALDWLRSFLARGQR